MRAIWLRHHGGPEALEPGEAPDPEAADGQVVVEVHHANITFIETVLRAGGPGPMAWTPPVIPGNGVGGVAGGRRVVTTTGGTGGYAERVAVPTAGLIPVPDAVALDDATALLADGRTALWVLDALAVEPGERVLVLAAAGGVGTLLVQLAGGLGATVIGAAGGPHKVAVAADLGAAETADYAADGWTDAIEPVDVLIDGVGGHLAAAALDRVRPGGRYFALGAASGTRPAVADDRPVTTVPWARPTPGQMSVYTARALDECATGRLRTVIGQRFPLDHAARAHAAIESRETVGKTLLDVRPPAER